ncbi:response regulator [bacterium]|jgi:FixJ family two-component response regulator|nr:response regulator [bacterium]
MVNTKLKIYVVDDDDSVRKALSRLMKSEGYEAETFNGARNFLDSVPQDTKGILVLDARMPGMDGFELQKILNDRHYNMRVIFISAYAEADDRERAMRAGAKGFLQKPFNDESLLDLIDSAMQDDEN